MDFQETIFDFMNSEKEKYVREITYSEAKPFLMKIHYARRMPCITRAFGLFLRGGGDYRSSHIRGSRKSSALHWISRRRECKQCS